MDWHAPIDIYCERINAGFWAEPVNALTNAAFLLAAFFAWRHYRAYRGKPLAEVKVLIVLVALIGMGSFLFHTSATRLTLLADVIPILLFQMVALWGYLRRVAGINVLLSLAGVAVFVGASQLLSSLVPHTVLNGSAGYLPSLVTLWLIAALVRKTHPESARDMAAAGCVFAASIAMRSLDMALCDAVPLGVHFLWHVLNAATLYLVVRGMTGRRRNRKNKKRTSASPRRKNTSQGRG